MAERVIPAEAALLGDVGVTAIRLLSLGAISVETERTYTWSSGIEAPIYSDMRLIISDVESRRRIADLLTYKVVALGEIDGIAGTATSGIPHAALVADRLRLPMVYVRNQVKDHGKKNQIEGRVNEGQRFVIIEDLISTGGSSIGSAEALRDAGAICEDVVAIFDYKFPISQENARKAGLSFNSLTNFPVVMDVAKRNGQWNNKQIEIVTAWYQDPMNWRK